MSAPGPMMKHALSYAELGWKIFPIAEPIGRACSCRRGADCPRPGKHPKFSRWQIDATSNWRQIENWWYAYPDASIGLLCDDLLLLDIDGPVGQQSLTDLEAQYGALPQTVTAATGRVDGEHRLLRSMAGRTTSGLLGPMVDTRGGGNGQGVLPPSPYVGGGRRRWIVSPFEHAIARAPKWLEEKLSGPPTCAASRRGVPHSGPTQVGGDTSRSGDDLRLCLDLLRDGASDTELARALRRSDKAREKGRNAGAYIARTVAQARSIHEVNAPVHTIHEARFEHVEARFGRAALTRIHLDLRSDDGEIVNATIVVPSKGYDSDKIRAVWRGCFPDVDPRGLTARSWSDVKRAWEAFDVVGRRLRVAIRFREIVWIRSAEEAAA